MDPTPYWDYYDLRWLSSLGQDTKLSISLLRLQSGRAIKTAATVGLIESPCEKPRPPSAV